MRRENTREREINTVINTNTLDLEREKMKGGRDAKAARKSGHSESPGEKQREERRWLVLRRGPAMFVSPACSSIATLERAGSKWDNFTYCN